MTEAKDLQRELIAFRIGSQEFCVDIMSVCAKSAAGRRRRLCPVRRDT
jgi:hypothetical protein